MQLHLTLPKSPLPKPIKYTDNILLIGSCFTEHMSERLAQHRFRILNNPHGILFNPLSVCSSLSGYAKGHKYGKDDLFYLNELWNSWEHHTRFSHVNAEAALTAINQSQDDASAFIRQADWIIITLGSAFQYYLIDDGRPVANNHRAPAQWFEKRLLAIDKIEQALLDTIAAIRRINADACFLITVSPVRHIRDGVVANNRSKARLLEAVHLVCEREERVWYFPAFELVIDILRDYRFFDVDFVHPNYLATQAVWEHFVEACVAPSARTLMDAVRELTIAANHRPRFPETEAHRRFLQTNLKKATDLATQYPFLDLSSEIAYFSQQARS